jgi:hypothetical protein
MPALHLMVKPETKPLKILNYLTPSSDSAYKLAIASQRPLRHEHPCVTFPPISPALVAQG